MYPFIYVFGREIPVYGLCIVIGVFLAAIYLILCCKAENLCWENAIVIGVTGLGIGLLGAKILYVAVSFKLNQLIDIIFNNISLILNGGFVFYGGLIGGFFGALLGARLAKCEISHYENILITAVPLVHSFGRIGCLCAGCCYGKPTSSIFGIIYRTPIARTPIGIPLIPIQLYEALYNLFIFMLLIFIKKKISVKRIILPSYMILYAFGRFIIEFFRYDYFRGIYFGLSTSQIISICLIIAGIAMGIYRKNYSFE